MKSKRFARCPLWGRVLQAAFFNREEKEGIWWAGRAKKEHCFLFVIYLHISSVLGMVKPFSAFELFLLPCCITSCQETVVRLMGQETVATAVDRQKITYFLVNFRDSGYFYICWDVSSGGSTQPVNYKPVRIGLTWGPPNQLMKRMAGAGDLFPWQSIPYKLRGSQLKTAEINRVFGSGHRFAGILFAEALPPVSAGSVVTERLGRD